MSRNSWPALIGGSLLSVAALANDDDGLTAVETSLAPDEGRALWELGAGIGGALTPAYPASSESTGRVLPLPIIAYRGRFLRAGEGSVLSGRLFSSERLELDISLNGSFDADSDDVELRNGMPDLGFLFELGPELEWQLSDPADENLVWKLELPLRAAFSVDDGDVNHRGYVFNPELQLERPGFFGAGSELSIGLSSAWASDRLMRYFYSVEPQFVQADRPRYDAGAGYLQSTLGITLTQRLDKRIAVLGLRLHSHHGARNETSPLYEDDITWSVFAGVAWSLWESERRAPPRR